jgi:hypothetical protein
MANKNKSKGYYHERKIVEWLTKIGIKTKRQPLSGALGGEYRGDIKSEILGHELVGEIKYRDKSNFPSPFTVLDGRDFAIYKRRNGEPQTIVILKGDIFEQLMENQHDTERTDTSPPEDR